jgi:hypothetical protein
MRDWGSNSFPLSDQEMLQALLRDDKLTEKERGAFDGMLRTVSSGKKLTDTQRNWARDVFVKLELDADVGGSLFSSGMVPRGKEIRLPFEDMPRPLKPPGRK